MLLEASSVELAVSDWTGLNKFNFRSVILSKIKLCVALCLENIMYLPIAFLLSHAPPCSNTSRYLLTICHAWCDIEY